LLVCGGCSEGGAGVPVFGTVTRHDEPVEDGQILFIPAAGTDGPSAAGSITKGRYQISAHDGLQAGNFVVEVKVGEVHRAPGQLRPDSQPEVTRFDREVSREEPRIDLELSSSKKAAPAR